MYTKLLLVSDVVLPNAAKMELLAQPKDGISALNSFLIVLFKVYQPGVGQDPDDSYDPDQQL